MHELKNNLYNYSMLVTETENKFFKQDYNTSYVH
jgi:hypothetical protein